MDLAANPKPADRDEYGGWRNGPQRRPGGWLVRSSKASRAARSHRLGRSGLGEVHGKQTIPDSKYRLRLKPMIIRQATDFVLDGLMINESTEWTIAPEGGTNLTIRNAKILNEKK